MFQGQLPKAEALFLQSLAILEAALGSEHNEVASVLQNLSIAYWEHGKQAQAEPLLIRTLRIKEKSLGTGHPEVATVLMNLAGLCLELKRYRDAEAFASRALRIREAALGGDHPQTAKSLRLLGDSHFRQRDYKQAEAFYQRALAIQEQKLAPIHPELAGTLQRYALLLRATRRKSEAARLLSRAQAILKANPAGHTVNAKELESTTHSWKKPMSRDSSPPNLTHSLHVLPCFADTAAPWVRKRLGLIPVLGPTLARRG